MEWSITVVCLHTAGHDASTTFKLLERLGISRMFVYCTIKRFADHQNIDEIPMEGRPRTVRSPKKVKAVGARIRRNPQKKQKIMAIEMKISLRLMSNLIREDLRMGAYHQRTGYMPTPSLKAIRVTRS
ncbi:uncharacterized protein LOC106873079 [Octopus bimaculoides]|uniref:uncharacterized protein LOC106873079 n=1 Tax=Octopus bimaculoides TaxID=37653 RepID=UPI00071D0485|nr:uncharacterized protein LOC106873079 [Octopus bimaculoides]|eukprot:XP_014775786.1 PREDICTED: uncharacterized protein LOC106873079 [Octopus bimaculoides]